MTMTPLAHSLPCGCTYYGEPECRMHAAAPALLAALKAVMGDLVSAGKIGVPSYEQARAAITLADGGKP